MTELSTKYSMPIGKKIERLRKIKGIKQEALASDLGITRQSLSKLEQSDSIGDDKLEKIAKALGVTPETIKEFNEETTFQNNIYDQNNTVINYNFNPIEKIVQLYDEKIELYEELLKSEREKTSLFESMLKSQESHTKKK